MTEPASFLPLAEKLAEASGEVIRRYFRVPPDQLKTESKSDESPVTIADRAAEEAMRRLIEAEYPEHGIFGEEHGFVRTDAEYAWVLDPIDGTRAFMTGMPIFGTLIALMRNGSPILGVINQPILNECWIGIDGRGTTLNGEPVSASNVTRLADSNQYSTDPDMFDVGNDRERVNAVLGAVKSRRYGGDCYSYALLASGHVDLVIDAKMQIYDFMPLVPVVDNAGGVITDWNGDPLTRDSDGHVVAAATKELHEAALQHLRDR